MNKIIELKDFYDNEEAALDFILLTLFADQMKTAFRKGNRWQTLTPVRSNAGRRLAIDASTGQFNMPIGRGKTSSVNFDPEHYCAMLFIRVLEKMEKKYPAAMKDIYREEKEFRDEVSVLENAVSGWNSFDDRAILNNIRGRSSYTPVYRSFKPLIKTARIMLGRLSTGNLPVDTSRFSDFVSDMTEQNGGSFSEFIQKMDDTENELWEQLRDTIENA
ncbi:MAG: hypothetical protein J1F11_09975 [Oscillospiraceae bacterium]|nr:hypothetical protein [Oscillospiraceae bacterium]